MAKITVELDIDCGQETCSKCKHRSYLRLIGLDYKGCNGMCEVFRKNVVGKIDHRNWQDSKRLPECIAAEEKNDA